MVSPPLKIGIAGVGAIGGAVARALVAGIDGLALECVCDSNTGQDFGVDYVSFAGLAARADLVVECLPAHVVPELTAPVFAAGKDIMFISSAALLIYPEILQAQKRAKGRAFIPAGALAGIDGVKAMRQMGITSAKIASTKKPMGFLCAPYVVAQNIALETITEKTCLFRGNAFEASRGFPANVNVAATLSLAGIGAEKTRVEIWADPKATGNTHEIEVKTAYSTLHCRIENMPDPQNPKSSVLAAQSIIASLKDMTQRVVIA